MGLFAKIKEGLKKTRDSVVGQIDSMLKSFTKIDEELFEELEELLVMGDVGKSVKNLERKLKKRVLQTRKRFTVFWRKLLPKCSRAVRSLISILSLRLSLL